MMRCLRLSSLLLVLIAGCRSPYKGLQRIEAPNESAVRFKPVFNKEVYRCHVDGRFLFKKFHFSGILFFKNLEDHSTRVVFQNEMGYSFFDFEWDLKDSFRVVSITPQLDKTAVIKTLQKDLELLLMRNLNASSEEVFTMKSMKGHNRYYRFKLQKGFAYYEVFPIQSRQIEAADKRPVTTIHLIGTSSDTSMPTVFPLYITKPTSPSPPKELPIAMLNDFYTASSYRQTEGAITCTIAFDAAHQIFEGHFPQQPIVPGVCTMHIVKALLEAALGRKLMLKESSAVKFLRLITPESSPDVSIHWKESDGIFTASATLNDGAAAIFKMNATYSTYQ